MTASARCRQTGLTRPEEAAISAQQQSPSADGNSLVDILRLIRSENVGPLTYHRLVRRFGSARASLDALPDLARAGGRRRPVKIPPAEEVEREIAAARSLGAILLTYLDSYYPRWLAETEDAPPVIGVLGSAELLTRPMVGIVGARNASANGRNYARKLARELGEGGFVIASGLARGIDAAAHEGALPTGTVGVLGCGLDVIYPPQNRDLFLRMSEDAAIISEFPAGTAAQAANFPRRNRLISGMSRAVAVIEANRRSGSLITARLALEQGREVFAVPGFPLDPRSEGPNWLLRQGAQLLERADDIIEELATRTRLPETPQWPAETEFSCPDERAFSSREAKSSLISLLSSTPVTVDELLDECQLSHQEAASALLEMELAGRLERLPGNRIAALI
ncbi:MAG: DNA-processing protein DprA [Rhodospirillales bacterium]